MEKAKLGPINNSTAYMYIYIYILIIYIYIYMCMLTHGLVCLFYFVSCLHFSSIALALSCSPTTSQIPCLSWVSTFLLRMWFPCPSILVPLSIIHVLSAVFLCLYLSVCHHVCMSVCLSVCLSRSLSLSLSLSLPIVILLCDSLLACHFLPHID